MASCAPTNRRRVFLALVLVICSSIRCHGDDQTVSLFELGCTTRYWNVDDESGLPADIVYYINQEDDGHLWIGTSRGMAYFDGMRFEPFSERKNHWSVDWNIHQIFPDPTGQRWAASLSSGILRAPWAGGEPWTKVKVEGSDLASIGKLISDSDGRMIYVVGTSNRLQVFQLEGDSSKLLSERSSRNQSVLGLDMSCDGTIWGVTSHPFSSPDTCLFYLEGGEVIPCEVPGEVDTSLAFWRERESDELRLVGRLGTYRRVGREWVEDLRFDNRLIGKNDNIFQSACDDHGLLWIPTPEKGLLVCLPDGRLRKVRRQEDFSPTGFYTVFCDREGGIWAGSRSGIFQIHRPPFVRWPTNSEIQRSNVDCVSEDGEGTLWFSGSSGVYYLEPGGEVVPAPGVKDRIQLQVLGLREGGALRVDWNNRIYKQTKTSSQLLVDQPKDDAKVLGIFQARDGGLFVSRSDGLMGLKEDRLQPLKPFSDDPIPGMYSMVGASNGTVLGSDGLRLWKWKSTGWEPFLELDGIRVLSIAPDDALWLGLNQGDLGFVGNRAFRIAGDLLDLPRNLTLLADQKNGLWIRGANDGGGILRFDRGSLEEWIVDRAEPIPVPRRFGRQDGLPSTRNLNIEHSMFEAKDGRIWMATNSGAAVFDPSLQSRIVELAESPPISIEEVSGGKVKKTGGSTATPVSLEISPGSHRIEIAFKAIDLSSPDELEYQYQLLGYDQSPVKVGGRRFASYQNLPPGEYTFEVYARNRLGIESPEPATLLISVEPAWHDRLLVRMGLGIAVIALMGVIVQIFRRKAARKIAAKEAYSRKLIEAQEEERKRMAGELHDGLGQQLLLIKNSTEFAKGKLDEGSPVRTRLEDITGIASDALTEVRSITGNLRPTALDRFGLRVAVQSMAGQIAEHGRVHVVHDLLALEQDWDETTRIAIYRFIQETLNNTMKHAEANEVTINARVVKDRLDVEIIDDGKGFDLEAARRVKKQSGLGLTELEERAKLMQGEFRIETKPGNGTRVRIKIPLPSK